MTDVLRDDAGRFLMRSDLQLGSRLDASSMPEPNSGCQLWLGKVDANGYGRIKIAGVQTGAHRVSFRLANGPIPNGLLVCHKCDVRSCINPHHLFLGSDADNAADKMAKGRYRKGAVYRGETHKVAKLTPEKVRAIRMDGRTYKEIGAEHSVSTSTVFRIKGGHAWRHLLD